MLTLIFTAIFSVASLGIAGVVNYQLQAAKKRVAVNSALNIAEAGLNYYKWHLKHAPEDFYDGTGAPGSYMHDFTDPEGGSVGKFQLDITAPSACSNTVNIKSTGWTNEYPNTRREVQIKYGKKSLADYAFVSHLDAWFTEGEALHGPVHSNGGISQDGTNDSVVSSAVPTYTCTPAHGCNNVTKPGVWGTGEEDALWQFPTDNFDFDAVAADYDDLLNIATSTGIYLPQRGLGYHLVFKNTGRVDVYRVTKLRNPVNYQDTEGKSHRGSWDIEREEPHDTYFDYPLPAVCGIIFVEDNVWVEGVVEGKVTVVAVKLPQTQNNMRTIVISGNLIYNQKDGSDVLGLIAQKDILVPLYSAPANLEINAAMMAQNGAVYRPYYSSSYSPYHLRTAISIYGSIITKKIWTWNWTGGGGSIISGYQTTNSTYDPRLTYGPPPGFPTIDEYNILQWEEVTEK